MTIDEKLAAILAAVQTDPGNRGLARDPHDNLFTATAGDFQAACKWIAGRDMQRIAITTGFFIPTGNPQAWETDGPLGAVFLQRAFHGLEFATATFTELDLTDALDQGTRVAGLPSLGTTFWPIPGDQPVYALSPKSRKKKFTDAQLSTVIAIERPGVGDDGCLHTMRGRDVSEFHKPIHNWFSTKDAWKPPRLRSGRQLPKVFLKRLDLTHNPDAIVQTIGIADGGNEIGMGKIPHETVVKNIPNGDLIHCRVPTDHLIVCGVSNWGAYALAAGVYVLRGVKPPPDLFDPGRERTILEVMVREGPLVDGVTGKQTATVDGLSWDEYVKPLVRIREILES